MQDGVLYAENRKLSLVLPDFDKGVLLQIVSGGIRTRERMYRHGRRNLAPDPFCDLQECSTAQLHETRKHRYWVCPRWEHLRPQWFRDMRENLGDYPECVIQCALAPIGYRGPPIDEVQRVFLDIELANRHMSDAAAGNDEAHGGDGEVQQPPPPPPPHPEGRPLTRRRLRGKQPQPLAIAQAVRQSHPQDCVVSEGGRLFCRRCGRNVPRSHATSVKSFWEACCYDNKGQVHIRAIARAASIWQKEKAKQQKIVEQIAEEHGGPVVWAGLKYSPVRCLKCEWRHPLFALLLSRHRYDNNNTPACPGNVVEAKKQLERLKTWVQQYRDRPRNADQKLKMHDWCFHYYTVYCKNCFIYTSQPPKARKCHDHDNCTNLSQPWIRVFNDEVASGRTLEQRLATYDGVNIC